MSPNSRIPVNRDALRQITRAAAENLSPRRAWTWAGFATAWMSLRAMVRLGRRLDDVLYPQWQDQRVEQPVFIFANGRSGTTMLHRLLSYDEEHFAGFKLHQSMFTAVSYQRFFDAIQKGPLGPLARRAVDKINETFFSGWEGIHEMGIDKEEEDEAIFVYALQSPTISLLNPYMEGYGEMAWLDLQDDEARRSFMDHYEATLKKHLYSVGGDRRFLNKNVFFAPRVRTVLERFPDARFLYLVRHPYKALPSFLNMFYEKWITHSPELPKESPAARELVELGYAYYRTALELMRTLPPERFHVVRYASLTKDPKRVVEEVYDWMDLEMSPAYRQRLEQVTQKQKRYKSSHQYSLAEYGLTEAEVYENLKDVFETFGFER